MHSDWSVTPLDGRDGVCLVTLELRNPASVARRVEVTNRLDGPVLPPRRSGVPEDGWTRDGFVGVVAASDRRVLGYACPATAERPPVAVVDRGRATDEVDDDHERAAVRDLADPRPPMDALPAGPTQDGGGDSLDGEPTVPRAVASWLSAVERRIERGERLTDGSVPAAADALEDATDRADDVTTLDARLAADARALRELTERTSSLAERAGAVDVPVAALRRLS
jgi:hypothetical protein